VPLGLAGDGANRNDFKRVDHTLVSLPIERPDPEEWEQHLCLDKGYD
jgi:putative transposase